MSNFAHRIATKQGALVEVCIKAGTDLASKSKEDVMKQVRQKIKMHKALKAMKKGDILEINCLDDQAVIRVNPSRRGDIKKPLKRFWQWLGFNFRRIFNTLKHIKKFNINTISEKEFTSTIKKEISKIPENIKFKIGETTETVSKNLRSELWSHIEKSGKVSIDRNNVIKQAETITGIKIHDFKNFTDREMALLLTHLVNDYIKETGKKHGKQWIVGGGKGFKYNNNSIKHIVAGHGHGKPGLNWRFVGSTTSVEDYVNQVVPKGEQVLTVVCEDGLPRNISLREGRILTSKGKYSQAA